MADFPKMPKTEIASVESSEYKQEIFDRLLSGWSPARISEVVKKRHGVLIKPEDIEAYRQQIPEEMFLGASELAKRLKNIDVRVDALLTMERLIVLLEQRLNDALIHERVTRSSLTRPSDTKDNKDTIVEHRAKLLFTHCERFERLLADIGERGPQVAEEYLEIKAKLPALREILQARLAAPEANLIEGEAKDAG